LFIKMSSACCHVEHKSRDCKTPIIPCGAIPDKRRRSWIPVRIRLHGRSKPSA